MITEKTSAKEKSGSREKMNNKEAFATNPFGFKPQVDVLLSYFQKASDIDEPLFQVLDMFPIPIQIFAPDGTSVFTNRASLDLFNLKNTGLLIGKYNVLKDPIMEQLGFSDTLKRVFNGEAVITKNFPAPIQDLVDRGITEDKPFEKATADLYNYPIWKDDKLYFVVCVFVVRSLYLGRPDVTRAKEYIDQHWQGEYDSRAVAKSVNMSVPQLYNLFKQHIGMTPGDYHKKCKVEHIKEKLLDKSLSIKEAFSACGEDSRGRIARVFKEITNMSPKQFRESIE
jgi:AraC-like DNA-binding protein